MARRRALWLAVLLALLLSSAWLGICRADEENPSPVVQQMVEAVSEPTLSDTILHLQDDPHQPGLDAEGSRYSFSPGLALAADYIGDHLATAGLTVGSEVSGKISYEKRIAGHLIFSRSRPA